MNEVDNQQMIVNEAFQFYSMISNPSFRAFKEQVERPTDFVLSPFVREVLLANFKGLDLKLIDRYYYIINMSRSFEDVNLSEAADFFSRELLAVVYRSSGNNQALLKTMLTQYSITEQIMQEKAVQESKSAADEEKKGWRLFGQKM